MLRFMTRESSFELAIKLRNFKTYFVLTKQGIIIDEFKEEETEKFIDILLDSGLITQILNYEQEVSQQVLKPQKQEKSKSEVLEVSNFQTVQMQTPDNFQTPIVQQKIQPKVKNPVFESQKGDVPITKKSKILYGDIYWVNFPSNNFHLDCGMRPALIVSSDEGNESSPKIHVVPISTKSTILPEVQVTLNWWEDCYIENDMGLQKVQSIIKCDGLTVIPKGWLKRCVGTLNNQKLEEVQVKLKNVLGNTSLYEKGDTLIHEQTTKPEWKDKDLFKTKVNKDLLNSILAKEDLLEKIEDLLKTLGFNFSLQGKEYLISAIKILLKNDKATMKEICKKLETKGISEQQIEKAIVARVKEVKKIKAMSTIQFLRHITQIIRKGEFND